MKLENAFNRINKEYFEKGMKEAVERINKIKIKDYPLVSVIVPTFNVKRTIEICINSILNQTYKNIEIIVNDANSNDGSIEIIKKFENVKLVFENKNRTQARNYAVKLSKGEYLFHIDSDMELSDILIEECVKLCLCEKYDALIVPEISVGKTFWGLCRALEKLSFLNDKYMESANRFISRKAYLAVNGYDESLTAGEDFDIHQRLLQNNFKIGRAAAFIKHYEVLSLFEIWKKGYIYGRTFNPYIKKYPVLTGKQFFIIRPAYIRNWKLFLKHPILTAGLIFMKGIMYFFTLTGIIITFISGRHKKT